MSEEYFTTQYMVLQSYKSEKIKNKLQIKLILNKRTYSGIHTLSQAEYISRALLKFLKKKPASDVPAGKAV